MLDDITLARLRELRDSGDTPAARAVGAALARLEELEIRDGAGMTLADALDITREAAGSTDRLGRAIALVLADYNQRRMQRPDVVRLPAKRARIIG